MSLTGIPIARPRPVNEAPHDAVTLEALQQARLASEMAMWMVRQMERRDQGENAALGDVRAIAEDAWQRVALLEEDWRGSQAITPSLPAPGVAAVPVDLTGRDRKDFAFLYGQLGAIETASVPVAGGTMTGQLLFSTDSPLSFNGHYRVTTDNLGSPGHTASGPNWNLVDIPTVRTRLVMRDLGQLVVTIDHDSLPANGISHALQLVKMTNGAPAVGLGTGIQLFAEGAGGAVTNLGGIRSAFSDVTLGTEDAYTELLCVENGVVIQALRCTGDRRVLFLDANRLDMAPHIPPAVVANALVQMGDAGFTAGGGGTNFAGSSAGTYLGINTAAGVGGSFADWQVAGVYRTQFTKGGQHLQAFWDAGTTNIAAAMISEHRSSAAAGVGFGVGHDYYAQDDALTRIQVGAIQFPLITPTAGAATNAMVFATRIGGAFAERGRFNATGDFLAATKVLATGGLGIGNSVVATTLATPGTVSRRMEVFSAAGVSLGAIPIYPLGSFS